MTRTFVSPYIDLSAPVYRHNLTTLDPYAGPIVLYSNAAAYNTQEAIEDLIDAIRADGIEKNAYIYQENYDPDCEDAEYWIEGPNGDAVCNFWRESYTVTEVTASETFENAIRGTDLIDRMMLNVLSDSTLQSAYWCNARSLVDYDGRDVPRYNLQDLRGETVEDKTHDGMMRGYSLRVYPTEDDAVTLTYYQFKDVIEQHYIDLATEEMDADTVFQIACFGEQVYA